MPQGFQMWIPLLSAIVGAAAGLVGAVITMRISASRLNAEFATERSAEIAIRQLLMLGQLRYRSFAQIRHHIGGFERNELRRLLVRAGAVRFMAADGTELWALRERVEDDYVVSRWKHPQAPLNKVPERELFPGAFADASDF